MYKEITSKVHFQLQSEIGAVLFIFQLILSLKHLVLEQPMNSLECFLSQSDNGAI